jgi:hypothetical protein
MPTVRAIVREAARNNYRFSSLILGIARSVPFQMKVKKASGDEARPVAAGKRSPEGHREIAWQATRSPAPRLKEQ